MPPQSAPPGQPGGSDSPVVYPKLLSASAYDISSDPIHRYTQPDLPAVRPPGYQHEYQLACEVPEHQWPHNAEKLGMVRYFPPPEEEAVSGKLLAYEDDEGTFIPVFYAFLYTHPSLECDHCVAKDIPCLQYRWDGPGPDNAWPNQHTGSLTVDPCVGCNMGSLTCDTNGRHILQPTRERLPITTTVNTNIYEKLRKQRYQAIDALTNGNPKTRTGFRLARLGKRRRVEEDDLSSISTQELSDGTPHGAPDGTPESWTTAPDTSHALVQSGSNLGDTTPVATGKSSDPLGLSLEQLGQVQPSIRQALKEREHGRQDVELAMAGASSATRRAEDAEGRYRAQEVHLKEVTKELEETKRSLSRAREDVITANIALQKSNTKLAAAPEATRSGEGANAAGNQPREVDHFTAGVEQGKSAAGQSEDAQSPASRRVVALEAELERSELAAHEQQMQAQLEKEDLTRKLFAAERRVKELEWEGRRRSRGSGIGVNNEQ